MMTSEQLECIFALRRSGIALKEIGEKFGITEAQTSVLCRRAGVVPTAPRRHNPEFYERKRPKASRDDQICTLRKTGLSYRQIAFRFHLSRQRIEQICKWRNNS